MPLLKQDRPKQAPQKVRYFLDAAVTIRSGRSPQALTGTLVETVYPEQKMYDDRGILTADWYVIDDEAGRHHYPARRIAF